MFNKEIDRKFIITATFFKKIANGLSVFKQISVIRNYLGMTQSQLANRSKIKQPVLSRIEKGDQNISLTTLERVADALNCDVQIVLTPKIKLEQIKENQIKKVAKVLIEKSLSNSAMEGHFLDKRTINDLKEDLIQKLKDKPKDIWNA